MPKLSVKVLGTSFIALTTFSATPATAALLNFSFTTENGSTGSFIVDTDTASDPNPAIGITADGTEIEIGLAYPNAVSDFSLATTGTVLSEVTADFGVFTTEPLDSPDAGILSAVEFPSGCLTATDFLCSIDVDLGYTGDVSELPVLSDDPLSYSNGIVLRIADFTTGLVNEELITEFQVNEVEDPNFQAVPEPNFGLITLAVGTGAGLLASRKMNRNKAVKKLYF
jgi:hypothetical protein